MKKAIIATMVLTACAAHHLTRSRSGWNRCSAADNVIRCGGRQVAEVECFGPADESCGALAVRYEGGERVFLYRPPGFDPEHPEFTGAGAVRPLLAPDASRLWFGDGDARYDIWRIYDPSAGIMQVVDAYTIFQLRNHNPDAVQLWKGGKR